MANDTGSVHITERRPITRSSSETVSKKVVLTTPNRKSERLEKRTPPSKSENHEKKKKKVKMTLSPLRRSERTANHSHAAPSDSSPSSATSRSSGTNKLNSVKQLMFEAEDSEDEGSDVRTTSSTPQVKRMDARIYRAVFKKPNKDCNAESNRMDKSTVEGGDRVGGKIDERFKGNSLDCKAVSKDGVLPSKDAKAKDMSAESRLSGPVKELLENNVTLNSPVPSNATTHETSGAPDKVQSDCHREETSQMLESRNSMFNDNLIRKCVGHDKVEKLISSERKRTMEDKHSDISATLVGDFNRNLIMDAGSTRPCSNIVGTSGSCSKRIRRISLSDVQRDQRKLINDVDQPSSKSSGEKLSTRNEEGKSGDSVERPKGNDIETEKIRNQQRSLHLLLKPEIAKLCEILLLPDNVKSMVENCLEYTMNNYQICTEPVSILQAFQLSLCWTAASLLKHKLDFEASLMLAKQHLNFECKKDVVDEINSRLWDLKENFLFLTGNSKVIGSPRASESSSRVYSNTEVTPEVELGKRVISKNYKEIQKHKNQWGKLIRTQEEEKQKLKKDIENEKADFVRRYKIEWAAIQSCSPNDAVRKEKLKVFNSEYDKRNVELKRQHEKHLKDLAAKQLEARRRKFRELWAPDELKLVASKELGTPHNAPKALVSDHVAEGKSFDNIVEAMTRTGTGVELSEAPNTNSSVVVLCSSPVELQTPLVKHAGVNEMDITASKDGPVSGSKCHNIAENEYDSQGNIISKHSNSREQCSDGATSMADEGEGHENFSSESHNDNGQDTVTLVLLSSNREICDGETLDVPSGEVALAVNKISSSNDGQVETLPSRQGKLDGTISSKPVSDGVKNMASLNSQSPEEHNPSINTMCMPNCENAAQIHEADSNNGSNNADALNSALSDERISSWNSKSPQEHVHSVKVICISNSENSAQIHKDDDGNGSNNVVAPNSPSIDERSADGTLTKVLDREVHVEMPGTINFTPLSMEQISRTAISSNSPDANVVILLNQPSLEKHNPNGVSSSVPTGQNPVEVSETSNEWATLSELDREAAVKMPSTVNYTDHPEKATPLNSSSTDQISVGGSVLDGVLSSNPSASIPSNDRPTTFSVLNQPSLQQQIPDRVLLTIPNEQILVIVPENNHGVAECQTTNGVVVDKSTTSDRTMTENNVSQEIPVSRPVDLIETLEQVQPLSRESSHDQDTAKEMQDSLVSGAVNIVPANESNHTSLAMEPPEQVLQLPCAGVAGCQVTDSVVVDKGTTSDRTIKEKSVSQETPVPRPVDLIETPEQVQPLSGESSHDRDTVKEMQDSLVSSAVNIVSANQSNHTSLAMEPPEQVQQLPSAGVARCQITDSVVVDKGTTSDRTSKENSVSQETPVPRPVDLIETPEQVQPLSGESSHDRDTVKEMQDSLVSSAVNVVAANQSNHTSLAMEPPEQVQQLPSAGVARCQITDSVVVDKGTTSDRTMKENSVSLETPVSRPVDLTETLEQVQPLSRESSHDQDTAKEMQDSLVCSAVNIVPANESNHTSLATEPPEQVQQLPSAGFLSSNQDLSNLPSVTRIEDQATNEDGHSSHIPEASIEVQNHSVEPASNLEVDSHSHQVVTHPASNLDLDSLMPVGVRTQSLDSRNLSTPGDIDNHPIRTAIPSASRIVPPWCHDPLSHELERIRKLTEQDMKNHEDMKLQLTCDFEKEFEELQKKFKIKLKEIEVEFQKTKKNLDTQLNTVYVHKILAETFRANSLNFKLSGASGMLQDARFARQSSQLLGLQHSTQPSLVASPFSCRPPAAASLQGSSTTPGSQTMLPTTQATSGNFSGVSARPPHINTISSLSGNLQVGREIRAPAPHLQPHRPTTSVPASSVCTVPHEMPTQLAPGNIPVTSSSFSPVTPSSFSNWQPRLMPTMIRSDPHRGHWPESTGGLPTPNLSVMAANSQSGINLPNVPPRVSDLASFNLTKSGTSSVPAHSPHQATSSDVVCLSDDD